MHGDRKIPLSVIIPIYNRGNQLKSLLSAMKKQEASAEIIVIDDHSSHDIGSICEQFDGNLDLLYLRLSRNAGPAHARNIGLENASYDYVAFIDSDCIPKHNWSIKLFEYLRDAPSYVAGVGGKVLGTRNDIFSKYMTYHQILEPHPRGWPFINQYLYLVTANCAYRKRLVVDQGGFDPTLRVAGGEDVGLGLKLVKSGYQLHYRPDAVVYHSFSMNWLTFIKTFYRYGTGCENQAAKLFQNESWAI